MEGSNLLLIVIDPMSIVTLGESGLLAPVVCEVLALLVSGSCSVPYNEVLVSARRLSDACCCR